MLVYGDSLSSGYGLAPGQGWVDLLGERLRAFGPDYKVVNASVSGETAAGGAARIGAVLAAHRPRWVIVALGANDGLRGASPAALKEHLAAIVDACRRARANVVLVGMRLPPNYGAAYTETFGRVFADVARAKGVPLVPFLLDGFAERREYFQPDGIHPTAAAQPLMLETVWKVLGPVLERSQSKGGA